MAEERLKLLVTLVGSLLIGSIGIAVAAVQAEPYGQPKVAQDTAASMPTGIRGDLDASPSSARDEFSTPLTQFPAEDFHISSRPALIDQFIDGFFARGMLTSEIINVVTERAITVSASKGQNIIGVANTDNLVVGGGLMILHADGKYWPYIIAGMSANTISIFPELRADIKETGRLERLWFNRAHPGKFYMRYLAQRIAYGTEFESPIAFGRRIAFIGYGGGNSLALGGLAVTAGAAVNYYDAAPTGASGSVATPARFIFGKTALVEFDAGATAYAQTGLFAVRDYNAVTAVLTLAADQPVRVTVLDEAGRALAYKSIESVFVTTNYLGHRRVKLSFFTGNASHVRFRFEPASGSATSLAVASVEAFESQEIQGRIVTKSNSVIVGLGDSWIGGDTGNTPERESILTQLAIELPYATIVNAGIGGNKIDQMLARFDTDVAPYNPDYVIVNTGTNEAYNPASSDFDPTATGIFVTSYLQLMGRIQSIGARPILLGPPALGQSDAEVESLAEWELLERSRLQYIRLMQALSDRPNAT